MNTPSTGLLAGGVLVLAAAVLTTIGTPSSRVSRVSAPAPADLAPSGPSVTSGGFTLASATVVLPDDASRFPTGPGAELLDANCAGCHSASMVLNQPPLKPEQWQAEVTKMRETYGAPVAERDVPAILTALSAISARRAAAH